MTVPEPDTRVVQQAGQARFGDVHVGVVAAGTTDAGPWARLSISTPTGPATAAELTGDATVPLPGQGRLRLVSVEPGGVGRRAEVTLELAPG